MCLICNRFDKIIIEGAILENEDYTKVVTKFEIQLTDLVAHMRHMQLSPEDKLIARKEYKNYLSDELNLKRKAKQKYADIDSMRAMSASEIYGSVIPLSILRMKELLQDDDVRLSPNDLSTLTNCAVRCAEQLLSSDTIAELKSKENSKTIPSRGNGQILSMFDTLKNLQKLNEGL